LYGLNVLMPTNIVSIKLLSRKNVHAENFLCPPLKTFSDRLLGDRYSLNENDGKRLYETCYRTGLSVDLYGAQNTNLKNTQKMS
jgi:hypothetical protein